MEMRQTNRRSIRDGEDIELCFEDGKFEMHIRNPLERFSW